MKKILLFLFLIFLLLLISITSILFGGTKIKFEEIIKIIFSPDITSATYTIIYQIRIPRILLGILVGGALAACGCVFQGILKNPMADNYTLGISGGAALGSVLGILLSSFVPLFSMPAFSFLGAITSVALIYFISSRFKFSTYGLILCGIVMNFLFSSVVLFLVFALKSEELLTYILWLMGDLSTASLRRIIISFPLVGIGILILILLSRDLNILSLGEEKARTLGVNPEKLKKVLFTVSSFLVGVCVFQAGIIGFVGLIVPHIIRRWTGPNNVILIPASGLFGASFLVFCDTLSRTIFAPQELPVGVITGIFGSIFFLILLLKTKKWEIF